MVGSLIFCKSIARRLSAWSGPDDLHTVLESLEHDNPR